MSESSGSDRTLRLALLLVALLVVGPMLFMVAFAVPMMGMWGSGWMPMHEAGWLWPLVMMIGWLLLLVGAGYVGYRWLSGGGSLGEDPALRELRLAYARGELSEEEYEERRAKLRRE
jgi:putative membrane protein